MTNITTIITEHVLTSLQGVIPSVIATCSVDGTPNVTYVSQVYYVDNRHVAISHQFFNKTFHNVRENSFVCVIVTCPTDYIMRKLILKFVESQTSGEIFENMKLQLEVIASMQQKEDVFVLRSADIFEVISIEVM